jgi:putative oxidoreductase
MSFADKFDLLNEFNILRIICGAFFIPHIVGKITVPATLDFFVAAGFKPPAVWMYIAGAIGFIHLLVAAAATYRIKNCWIWVIGGVEYCIFWAICCLVVAMHAWR